MHDVALIILLSGYAVMITSNIQVIIIVGGIPIVWNLAGSMMGYYGYSQDYEVYYVLSTLCACYLTCREETAV